MTLEQQIKKQTLKLTLKYFVCPTFLGAKRKLSRPDKIPSKSVMGRMIQLWIDYYLPLDFIGNHGQIQLVKETLKQFAIKVDHTKYRGDFWEERLLARIRMGVLPTKKWASRLGLEQNSRCRHCKLDEETAQHLFLECPLIIKDALRRFLVETLQLPPTFESIRNILIESVTPTSKKVISRNC